MIKEKIPAHLIAPLLFTQWIAKFCILFPIILLGQNLRNIMLSIVFGVLLWSFVVWVVKAGIKPGESYFNVIENQFGKKVTVVIGFTGLWYFIAHTAVFMKLWAALLQTYLLPDIPGTIMCALPMVVGITYLGGGIRFRARICKISGIILFMLTAILACLAGSTIDGDLSHMTIHSEELLRGGYEIFACMNGMFLPLLLGTASKRQKTGRSIRLAGCACAVIAGIFCVTAGFFYEPEKQWLLDFPAIEVMQRLRPFGINPGRLDIVLVLLLAVGLTMTVADGIWNVREIYNRLYAEAVEAYGARVVQWLPDVLRSRGNAVHTVEVPEVLPEIPYSMGAELYSTEFSIELSHFPKLKKYRSYGTKLSEKLSAKHIWWWILLLVIYILATGFRDAIAAVNFYRVYNMLILVPLMLGFYVVLGMRRGLF